MTSPEEYGIWAVPRGWTAPRLPLAFYRTTRTPAAAAVDLKHCILKVILFTAAIAFEVRIAPHLNQYSSLILISKYEMFYAHQYRSLFWIILVTILSQTVFLLNTPNERRLSPVGRQLNFIIKDVLLWIIS